MIDTNIHGFTSITNDLEDDLLVYCKILFFLRGRHCFDENCIHCKKWKHTVNVKNLK